MDDYFPLLEQLLEEYRCDQNIKTSLLEFIENLTNDVKNSQNNASMLQNEIKKLTLVETFGITTKYVNLKEAHETLRLTNAALRDENDDLKIKILAREQEMKQDFLVEKEQLENHYKNLLTAQENNCQSIRKECEKEIQHLLSEVTLTSTESSLEIQKAEERYKQQINDLNKKLRENVETSNTLRNELRKKNQKVAELEEKIHNRRAKFDKNTSFNNSCQPFKNVVTDHAWEGEQIFDRDSDTPINRVNPVLSKYRPLEIENVQPAAPIINDTINNTKKTNPKIYRTSMTSTIPNFSNFRKNNNLPPLITLNDFESKNNSSTKKRKLFDPTNLDYLDEVDN